MCCCPLVLLLVFSVLPPSNAAATESIAAERKPAKVVTEQVPDIGLLSAGVRPAHDALPAILHPFTPSPLHEHLPSPLKLQDPWKPEHFGEEEDPGWLTSVWLFLRKFILPKELDLIYELRAWITGLEPIRPRTREADLRRTDEIYQHAVYLAEGDATQAMLGCAWATLPYHTFPARIPLVDLGVTVPVSTESLAAFKRRMANLPGRLFPDARGVLDRDKIPHFFGSAWLQLLTRRPGLAEFAGEALEWAESVFKLEGSRDPRDVAVNCLGIRFAQALQAHRDVQPSDFLKLGLNTHECKHDTQNPSR